MKHLIIHCSIYSRDYKMFREVINRGIDSHLEGFTKSEFKVISEDNYDHVSRTLDMKFHPDEIHILVRRLEELEEKKSDIDEAEAIDSWICDIKEFVKNEAEESKAGS